MDLPLGNCPVHGDGPKSKLMLVGEALGENEAILEKPFQGQAGQLLDKMLGEARIPRNQIYISNLIKCRPTTNGGKKNRPPTDDEISSCKIWLWEEIKAVEPLVIVTLGKIPTYTLLNKQLKKSFKLSDIIGKEFMVAYCKAVIIPCLHPSYLMQHGRSMLNESIKVLEYAGKRALERGV